MDRVDIFCWIPSLRYEELVSADKENLSNDIRKKVEGARKIQKKRFGKGKILTNSEMKIPQIKKYCQVDSNSQIILKKYVDSGKLSARGYHRILKVARTIADLEERDNISFNDITEALIYRSRKNE